MNIEEKPNPRSLSATWLRKIASNDKGRDFIVGDIHGCLDELISLLAHARFNPKRDRLFSVGDLIDRGPKSAETLELLEKPWFFAARGNHEQMLLDHWDAPDFNPAYDSGWLSRIHTDSVPYYKALLDQLPHVIKVGSAQDAFYVMHAELWNSNQLLTDASIDSFSFPSSRQAFSKILWSRHVISNHWTQPGKKFHAPTLSRIFCGHTIVQLPTAIERSLYIDTGAFVPYIDSLNSQAEHYGLSLVEAGNLRQWFAPTCHHYRGTIVDLGIIDTQQVTSPIYLDETQIGEPRSPQGEYNLNETRYSDLKDSE